MTDQSDTVTTAVIDVQDPTEQVEGDAAGQAKNREVEHYEEIKELNKKFVAAHQKWEILKDQTSGAKKYCDELGKRLSNLIAQGPDYQQKLDFDQAEASADQVDETNDAWKDVPIVDALGLTATQLDKLEEEGVKTMGQLEEFRATKGLLSIKGFGQKAVDKIEDQIIDWLDENRDRFGEVVEEDDQADDDDESDEDYLEDDEDEDDGDDEGDEDAEELLDDM